MDSQVAQREGGEPGGQGTNLLGGGAAEGGLLMMAGMRFPFPARPGRAGRALDGGLPCRARWPWGQRGRARPTRYVSS